MNILFFIDELGSGGAQRQMVTLAIEFKKKNHDVTFLTYRKSDFYEKTLSAYGISEVNILEDNLLKRVLKCRKYIRSHKFDSVLAFLEGPSFIAEVSGFPKRKWKLVVGERSANPAILTSLKQKLYRSIHQFADFVVTNSYCNLNMIKKINPFLKESKCKVLYNIYDSGRFHYNPNFKFKKNNKLNLVIASNLRYWKNLDGLIEGVNLLPKEFKELLKIDWYGHEFEVDMSKKNGIKKIADYELEDIFTFHNPTKKILDVMTNADAIGLFSLFEGLSNTICEGMALGKPIITTRVSDNSLFIKDRITGFLCEADDPHSISHALKDLINAKSSDLANMGSMNRQYFLETFDMEKTCNEYLSLLS